MYIYIFVCLCLGRFGEVPALRGVHLSPIGCSTIEHTHVHTLQWRSFTPNTRKPTLALTHVSMQGVSTVSLSPDQISDGCSGTHLPLLYLLGGQRSHEDQLSGFRRSRTQFPYWGSDCSASWLSHSNSRP